MGLLNPYFTISDGNSFDIHYMTLALLWLASTCYDKRGIMIFRASGEEGWTQEKGGSEMTNQLSVSLRKYKCNYGSVNWFDSGERPLAITPVFSRKLCKSVTFKNIGIIIVI